MKNQQNEFGSYNRLKKILSSAALCAMMTSNLAGAATYDVNTVAAKGIGSGLGTSDFNSIVDTLKGWVLDDNDTNDGADDTATFAGDICNGSGDCLSDAVFTGGNVGIGTDSPDSYHSDASNMVIYDEDGRPGITLASPATGNWRASRLFFADGLNNGAEYSGGILYEHSNGSENTDRMDFYAAGEKNLSIQDGAIGIGTGSPDRNLTVEDVDGSAYMNIKGGTREILMGVDGGGGVLSTMSDHKLSFRTNNSDKMVILSGGNVGIGTTTPTEKLDVAGNVKATAFIGDGSQLTNIAGGKFVDGTTAADAVFTGGNVGIGTDNPTSILSVYGGDNEDYAMEIVNGGGNGKGLDIRTGSAGVSQVNASFRVSSWNGAIEKFWVGNNGNVGIGTTTPTEKLDVSGNVKTESVIMETKTDKGVCDSANEGQMVYERVNGVGGTFFGCMQNTDGTTYSWVNLQVFGQ